MRAPVTFTDEDKVYPFGAAVWHRRSDHRERDRLVLELDPGGEERLRDIVAEEAAEGEDIEGAMRRTIHFTAVVVSGRCLGPHGAYVELAVGRPGCGYHGVSHLWPPEPQKWGWIYESEGP